MNGGEGYYADVASKIPEDQILNWMFERAAILTPVQGVPTWVEQNRRGNDWPFIFTHLAERLQHMVWARDETIRKQRDELIAVRKELSALKRAKK